jgi:hypothetical protein
LASGQFGPLSIRPVHGTCWAPRGEPSRVLAPYHRTHGIRYFHGCYSPGDDQLWGVVRRRKGGDHTLAALKSIRAARPGGYRLFVIAVREQDPRDPGPGAARQRRAVLHACQRIVGRLIEAQFGPLRTFVMDDSSHPDHAVLARRLQDYLRWRNASARHPDILAAQRKERARTRSERHQRWGRPKPQAA